MKKALLCSLLMVALALINMQLPAQNQVPKVEEPVYFDISPPLRDMIPTDTPPRVKSLNKNAEKPDYPFYEFLGDDPVWQRAPGSRDNSDGLMLNFEGTSISGMAPSDANGDIGPNHYVQVVNARLQVFSRDGASLYGPVNVNTLFSGVPGGTTNDGDPIVLYDQDADRWLISQFSIGLATKYIMIAVSQTGDPTGSYYRWSYSWGGTVPDYPKFGVWRNAYLMGLNIPGATGANDVAAFNRAQMIAGNASPQVLLFNNSWRPATGLHCIQPLDNVGPLAPTGTPGLFITINDNAWSGSDQLWIYELSINWTFPIFSTFNRVQQLNVAAFDSHFAGGWDNIPQPGTSQKICVLPTILMYRATYRNFGTHQTIVCCHDVDVNGSDHAGIRWYELRKTTGNWYVYQQGTYAPDSHHRWMGSISINGAGEIALGFSVASSSLYPSIAYTGRMPSDPLGNMTIAETRIYTGSASQTTGNRWGDYSTMSVDPNDDKTFWYTTQYSKTNTSWYNWGTRIAALRIDPYCTAGGGCDEYISNVTFGSINNSSGCDNYRDYTNLIADLPLNATQLLTVTNGNPIYAADQCGVWVDWNRDGDFNDAGETITLSGTPGVGPYTANISPPAGATTGPVRMRVRITYTGAVDPCGTTAYGEVEDYTINLTPKVPNVWTGAFNRFWGNAQNWSLGYIPGADDDAIITSAGYQPVTIDYSDKACKNLTIESGEMMIKGYTMQVNGNLSIHGKLSMDNADGKLNVTGNVVWQAGSTADITAASMINVYGNWNFNAGANANLLAGFVDFRGTEDNWIRSYSANSSFYNLRIYKTGGAKSKVSFVSTQDLVVNNLTFINPGAILESHSNFNIVMKGAFNYYGAFDFTMNTNTGSTVFSGTSQNINNYSSGSGIFNNVLINSTTGTTIVNGDVTIANNLTINSGQLNAGANTINIGGNWTNNNFPTGFNAGTGRVKFIGSGHQYVYSSENFNILEANMGAALRITNASHTVTCNQYHWTSGGIDVVAGTFTALDLTQSGIYGGYWLNPGGTINLTKVSGWVDLNGSLNIFGGEFNVYGGSTMSYWPYAANATINMSGGVLDFKDQGIYVYNSASYSLTENISGGIIRTSRGFIGNRADFTPSAGVFEFYGALDWNISQSNGCTLHNVVINKSAKEGGEKTTAGTVYDDRSGELLTDGGKANTMTLVTNFTATGNLTIEAGSFNLGAYTCNVAETTRVFGNLIMNDPANDLTTSYMLWDDGSTANVTAGTFHASAWRFNEGTTAKLGTGNTTYITEVMYFPTSNEAEFGNLVRGPLSKNVLDENPAKTYYPVEVMGNLVIKSGAGVSYPQSGSPLIVAGNADIESGSIISFSGAGIEVGGTLNLAGKLELLYGQTATVQGELTFPASGWLLLYNGTFTNNYDAASGFTVLSGKLTMNNGSLLEFPGRSVSLGVPFVNEISGGTLRFGRAFSSTAAGTFQQSSGTIEFVSSNVGHYIQLINGNFANDLVVNKPSGTLLVHDDLTLKGNLSIDAGVLNSNNKTIRIAGDWLNNVGPAAFAETNSRVIFNGATPQFCSTEDFYTLEVDKSNELLYNVSGHNITCQIYDWTSGGIWISPGNFTAWDLADNGLFGTYAIFGGVMDIYQDAGQYVDLNGDIIIGSDGHLNIYGGLGDSYWPWQANTSLTMSGNAVLDIKDVGIWLHNSLTYTLTTNITGGTIRTPGYFQVSNAGFTPAGGTVELYGGLDAYLSHISGTYFHNLLINKTGGDGSKGKPLTDRNGNVTENTKGNLAWVNSNLQVNNNLIVEGGTLHASGNTLTVGGNVDINSGGLLNLSSSSILRMASAKSINVNNGGMLGATGLTGTEAQITRTSSGFYAFNIESGGTIAAEHAFFEYMNTSGVNVKSGAMVDPTYSFHNCTFRYGQSGGRLLTVNNNQTFEIHNATFPPNVWGGTYNASKSINAGLVTFVDAVGPFAGSPHEHDPFNRIFWGDEPDAHNISLPAGWSGLSSYLMPANTDIAEIFAPVFSNFIVAQTMTEVYYPAGGTNTIGNWASQSAYKVKMSNAAVLSIVGFEETNKILPLSSGWNLIPVIANTPVNSVALFGGANLTIAKDVAGVGVYWPSMGINTLGNLLPGKAYYTLMGSPGSVTFPPKAKEAWTGIYPNIKFPETPWNEFEISPSSHLIAIESSGMNNLLPGDVLGVFSWQGVCYGVTEISDPMQNAVLTAYAGDPMTGATDGFDESEPMSYRLFRPQTAEVFDVEVDYNLQMPHTGYFAGEGLSAIKTIKLTATGIAGDLSSAINIYPNPTDGTIRITGIDGFDQIELIGLLGATLKTIQTDGESNLSIDLSEFQPGVYQIKLTGNIGTVVKRVVRK